MESQTETTQTKPQTELGFLRNIGLVITYKCQVACPHCIVHAGPDRTVEMRWADASRWIREIAAYREGQFKLLSLTGGEPFFNLDHLRRIATLGSELGLLVTAVSNAFWASTPEAAIRTLGEIPSIRMLALSADLYHQPAIPLERVRNAVRAARELGVEYTVAVCTQDEQDPAYLRLLKQVKEFADPGRIYTAMTMPVGRARTELDPDRYQMADLPAASACTTASTPMILPDGRVIACVGPLIALRVSHPLMLGNARLTPVAELLDRAESNTLLHAIRVWGPRKLVEALKATAAGVDLPTQYIKDSPCDVCQRLFRNPKLTGALSKLAMDAEFREKVAYGRVHYLRESSMASQLQNTALT
jgi:organic radical activating enzyme